MTNYIILLPPSESKIFGGDENKPYRTIQNLKKYNSFISLNSYRELVFDEVKKIISLNSNITILEKIFELKGKKLQEAIEINLDMLNEATIPAIKRYNGVMFKSIDYENLNSKLQENFNNSIIFIDGKFGILKPTDLIPNYKLKLSSKIEDLNLINFWKEHLYSYFNYLFKDKLVINLLPNLHEKVISNDLKENIINIKFCKLVDNKLVNIGHDSKKLKGDLISYILKFDHISIKQLKEFKHIAGYTYSNTYSIENNIIYLI